MVTNLGMAKSLIQADLDDARNVLDLTAHQIAELKKAPDQIEAFLYSRNALRVECKAGAARMPSAYTSVTDGTKPKRVRKLKILNVQHRPSHALQP